MVHESKPKLEEYGMTFILTGPKEEVILEPGTLTLIITEIMTNFSAAMTIGWS